MSYLKDDCHKLSNINSGNRISPFSYLKKANNMFLR